MPILSFYCILFLLYSILSFFSYSFKFGQYLRLSQWKSFLKECAWYSSYQAEVVLSDFVYVTTAPGTGLNNQHWKKLSELRILWRIQKSASAYTTNSGIKTIFSLEVNSTFAYEEDPTHTSSHTMVTKFLPLVLFSVYKVWCCRKK